MKFNTRFSVRPSKKGGKKGFRSGRMGSTITVGNQSATGGRGAIEPSTVTVRGVRCENKYFPYTLVTNFTSIPTTPKSYDLTSGIAEGTDYLNRVGREIRLTGLRIFGQLVGGQSNSVTDEQRNVVRLSVVENPPGGSLTNYTVSSVADPRLWSARRVLFDKLFSLSTPGRDSTGYLPACVMVDEKIPLSGQMLYAGSAANTQVGFSYSLWMVSDSAAIPNPGFVNGSLAVSFVDQ